MKECTSPLGTVCKDPACSVHFDGWSALLGTGSGAERIKAERERQLIEEGYLPDHDREHTNGALAYAAACYAAPKAVFHLSVTEQISDVQEGKMHWHEPWPTHWRRPPRASTTQERIRELEKAGALIAAEIDRLLAQEASDA